MRRALVIVGKAPRPGHTKTRLLPHLSPDSAAALYEAFLRDTVGLGLALRWERTTVVHPRDNGTALAALLPAGVSLLEQAGDGLADALTSAFDDHYAAGFDRVVLISSDNPTLPAEILDTACNALTTHDLALGPTADGGYYLIAMRRPHPEVFVDIDWSTERVYAQTLARAANSGLSVARLDEWADVDEPADLDRLQRELHKLPLTVAPWTRAALATAVRRAIAT